MKYDTRIPKNPKNHSGLKSMTKENPKKNPIQFKLISGNQQRERKEGRKKRDDDIEDMSCLMNSKF
jgi:hypothetical protein